MTMDDRQLTERIQDAYRIEMTDDVRRRQLDTITVALTAPPVAPVVPAPATMRLRRRFAAIVAAVTVLSPAAVAVAAESSLPGDVLYPVKQVTEDIRSMVDPTIAARHRLEEADEMHAAGFPPAVVQDVLSDADEAITIAGDPVDLRTRWMESSARMDVEHAEGEMVSTPPSDGVGSSNGVGPSTPPTPETTSGHDDDRMVDGTSRDDRAPADGSEMGRDDGTGHDGAPPTTISDSGTSDSGTGRDSGGATQNGSGMPGNPGTSGDQGDGTDQGSTTSHDSSSMGAASDGGTMDGAGSGSGG